MVLIVGRFCNHTNGNFSRRSLSRSKRLQRFRINQEPSHFSSDGSGGSLPSASPSYVDSCLVRGILARLGLFAVVYSPHFLRRVTPPVVHYIAGYLHSIRRGWRGNPLDSHWLSSSELDNPPTFSASLNTAARSLRTWSPAARFLITFTSCLIQLHSLLLCYGQCP
jgi:hypothetical protein